MGEGGCVLTDNLVLARIVESMRDWGRDCWCEPGEDNRCFKRFEHQMGSLPPGYDHKYIFSHVGYNLKSTDVAAALGLQQLGRIDEFGAARRRNWARLREGLDGLPHLLLPEATAGSDPSWFGFAITVRPDAPFAPGALIDHLESSKVATRRFFAGNLTRHPAYEGREFRVSGPLTNSDITTECTFWIGVYPGLTDEMIDHSINTVSEYVTLPH
jgi:CDP-6-deoxy-D-xylo-4-hexulose-3-dehydrase